MTASEVLTHGLEATFWFSLLVLLVLLLRSEVAKRFGPRAAMLLWALPGLRLVAPTLRKTETVVLPPEEHWVKNAVPPEPVALPAADPVPAAELPIRFAEMVPAATANTPSAHDMVVPAVLLTEEPAPVEESAPLLDSVLAAVSTEMVAGLVLCLWFAGAALAVSLCFMRSREWRRTVLAETRETPAAVTTMAEDAAVRARTTKSFTLVSSGAVTTPQLLGLREPILALPTDFEDRYTPAEQEMALLHELTHLKRFDLVVLAASEFAFSLQWFNPLTPRARKALRADQEAACDEAVRSLGVSTKSYAELLLKSARGARPVPALTLDSHLKERIVRMQNPTQGPLKRALFITASCAAALGVAGFTASSTTSITFVQEEEDQPPWERFAAGLEEGEDRSETKSRGENDRVLMVDTGRGDTKVLILEFDENGKLLNEDQLDAFTDETGIEFNVTGAKDGEPRFQFETRGKSIQIERLSASKRAALEAEKNVLHRQAEQRELRDVFIRSLMDEDADADERKARVRMLRKEVEERRAELEGKQEKLHRFHFEFEHEDDEDGKLRRLELRGLQGLEGLKELEKLELLGDGPVRLGFLGEPGEVRGLIIDGDTKLALDEDKVIRFAPRGSSEGFFGSSSEEGKGKPFGWVSSHGDEPSMILLSNPFASVKAPDMAPPTPPAPKAPKAPKLKERKTEEGTWILIPEAPDMSSFEETMEAWGEEMEAWGEKMEEWGEEMEERGELVEDLADDCEDHIDDSDEPTILRARIPGSRDYVRAVCASGGKERLRSEELQRFVQRSNLSSEERRAYRETIKD
ncbi:M56 family metallopeptidase [Parvularcula maris]|uniref:Peptidase M56 domain-containing protein n=1 Tax=Parvularcula maris TaxID=2965077 RepID=A0A9X2L9K5_9PROT|nr:M56 family metallopeptidase [Parvularcula maris]MCQ8185599.1 hypothetical protein [Parvularcula maris]